MSQSATEAKHHRFGAGLPAQATFQYVGPCASPGQGHLYVVEFPRVGIKVGRTSTPTSRVQDHERNGRIFGHPRGRVWMSPPHFQTAALELDLIEHCSSLSGPSASGMKTEYFPCAYEPAVAFAEVLDFGRPEIPPTLGSRAPNDLARSLIRGLRAERARANLSQEAFGARLGWSRATVVKIEAGDRQIAAHELSDICRGLGVGLRTLLVAADPSDLEALDL
jgi:DNA-binding XRE family transcriptional regulator